MENKSIKIEHMATPTFAVNKEDFEDLRSGLTCRYVVHGRRGLKLVPKIAQEIGENEVIFPEAPQSIIFRRRFTTKKVERKVRFITADNSDRYDLKIFVNLREL